MYCIYTFYVTGPNSFDKDTSQMSKSFASTSISAQFFYCWKFDAGYTYFQ